MAPDDSSPPSRPPGSYRIGSIGGIDVYVRASWLLIALLIAVMLAPQVEQAEPGLGVLKYVAGLAFAVLLYLSVLLHEMSHALVHTSGSARARRSAVVQRCPDHHPGFGAHSRGQCHR